MQKSAALERLVQPIDRALAGPPLRSPDSLVTTVRVLLGLSLSEARALVQLIKFDFVSRKDLLAAMSSGSNPVRSIKGLDVTIHTMRRKLAGHNIAINTIWGSGFYIDKISRDRTRQLIAEFGEDVIYATTPSASQDDYKKGTMATQTV